jgi:hypothetical protein
MSMTPEQVDQMLALLQRMEQVAINIQRLLDRAEEQRTQGYRVIGEQLSDLRTDVSEILDEVASEDIPGLGGTPE